MKLVSPILTRGWIRRGLKETLPSDVEGAGAGLDGVHEAVHVPVQSGLWQVVAHVLALRSLLLLLAGGVWIDAEVA